MMRLPRFHFHAPTQVAQAVKILAEEGPAAALLAGGTDLLPNMQRGQQQPKTLVALRRIKSLAQMREGSELELGSGLTLTELVRNSVIQEKFTGLWQAAGLVASPQLRNMGTLGGNICLDTRCNYYNQSEHWRKAINYCMKKDGEICWVVTKSKKCHAVSSTDTAPALISLGAKVRLVSTAGERLVDLGDFYLDDGINYMDRRPDEILVDIILDSTSGWRSTYWKLRRRGSFDFPILSVAAAILTDPGGTIRQARMVLGAVAPKPLLCKDASDFLKGRKLNDEVIEETGRIMTKTARPVNNTDLTASWRKKVIPSFVTHALRELRGDEVQHLRQRIDHQARN